MYDLQELYQEFVLDHSRRPRNFRKLEDPDWTGEGFNPLCGDQITLYLKIDDDIISEVGFEGVGCAISKASASMMTEGIKGKSKAEAKKIFDEFRRMITNGSGGDIDVELLGDVFLSSHTNSTAMQSKRIDRDLVMAQNSTSAGRAATSP